MKTYFYFLTLFFLSFISCSEYNSEEMSDLNYAEQRYKNLTKVDGISLSSLMKSNPVSRAQNEPQGIPYISDETLQELASLSQTKIVEFRDSLLNSIGIEKLDEIEQQQDETLLYIFTTLGGHDGFDQFQLFAQKYIVAEEGWNSISKLLPMNLNTEQINIYIYTATYIDRVSRKLYNAMTCRQTTLSRADISRDNPLCKQQANLKLSMLGLGIEIGALADWMSGGATLVLTPLEATGAFFDATSIWIDYEICCGRWH